MLKLAAAFVLAVASTAPAADTTRTEAAGLRMSVPRTWTRIPATGDTQAAKYRVPSAARDPADTEFVLFTAAEGKADGADAQVDRWAARFTQPDGRRSRDAAEVARRIVDGLTVTTFDVSGTYVGAGAGTVAAGVSGYRMLGAVVEGPGGPWRCELLGPKATVTAARADFDALLFSLEAHQ